jgi:hypothetical protein
MGTPVTATPVSRRTSPGGVRSAPVALVALVVVVAALALHGVELAAGVLRAGPAAAPAPALGEPLSTSFGSLTVEHAQTIDGLTSGDMWNGMTHGIQSLVQPDEAQVAVAVYLANASGRAVPVDPGQFRLIVDGRSDPVAPTGTTVLPLSLMPGSGVRGTLVFVVPLGAARTSVTYLDPAGPPITVAVGVLGEAPPPDPGHAEATPHNR